MSRGSAGQDRNRDRSQEAGRLRQPEIHTEAMRDAFDRLAESWDEWHGRHSPQAAAFRQRAGYLRAVCEAHGRPRVLDIGCGTGLYLLAVSDLVSEAVGIDLSPKMISQAEQSRQQNGSSASARVHFSVGSAESLDATWGRFDVIVFLGSLEHMRDPAQALGRLPPLLNRGGEVVTILRDPRHPATALRRWLGVNGGIPWHRHISPAKLHRLAGAADLRCTRMQPLAGGRIWRSLGAIWPHQTYAAHLMRATDQP